MTTKKKKIVLDENGRDKNSVLIIAAHSDDQVFGPGGTIAKYAKFGKKIHTIILSYGEMGMPIHKRQYAVRTRVSESLDVDKYLGGNGVTFIGLEEGKFMDQYIKKNIYVRLKKLITQYNPSIIFTHSIDDPLPDHRATNKILLDTIDRMRFKSDVYMFDVWTFFNFKKRHYVKIVIDISDSFKIKIKALDMFQSQKLSLFTLMWSVYLRAWLSGWSIKAKYGEVFYKIR